MSPSRAPVVLSVGPPAGPSALRGTCEELTARDAPAALEIMAEEWVQVLLLWGADRVALAETVAARWPETVCVAVADAPPAQAALWLRPDAPAEQLRQTVLTAAQLFDLRRERDRLALELRQRARGPKTPRAAPGFDSIVRAPGSPMDAVCRMAAQVASFDVPALITGETGVGKDLLARAIHAGSLRSDRPFHAVNCGAIPDELLESELFGHCKGAFTGAHAARVGLLEQGDGGTVFLDEIGDTSPAFQVKLLRFLQEGEIRPVGSNDTRAVDVRVVAATNHDLEAAARAGRFRQDLYFRLAVCPIHVPPLRARADDIAPLALRLLDGAMAAHGKRVKGVDAEAMALLAAYDWPGNVRELHNEITRLLMLCTGDALRAGDLSPRILRMAPPDAADDPLADAALAGTGTLKDRVERLEARILREALLRHGWNKSRAAEELGLSRVGLRAKLERYGVCAAPQAASLAAE